MSPELRETIERYFLHAGMPHLQHDYDPREDTLTRLAPFLLVIFVLGLVASLTTVPLLRRLAIAAVLVALIVGAFVIINRLRGRRAFALPDRVGYIEAGVLLIAPAAASLVTDGDPLNAAYVLLATAVIAGVLYVLVSLGIFSLIIHLGRAALIGIWQAASIAARAMPLMLALLLFLFLSTETWQAFGQLVGWRFGGVMILFATLVLAVLHGGLKRERQAIMSPELDAALAGRAKSTPAAPLCDQGIQPHRVELRWIERVNVSVALLVSLTLRVLAVGLAVGSFFFIFGLLVMDRELTTAWVAQQAEIDVFFSASLDGREVVVTEPLIRVSLLLGGFSSLYFAVSALGDSRNRQEFVEDEIDRLSNVVAASAYYRGALSVPAEK
jgi:MFS family permease